MVSWQGADHAIERASLKPKRSGQSAITNETSLALDFARAFAIPFEQSSAVTLPRRAQSLASNGEAHRYPINRGSVWSVGCRTHRRDFYARQ